MEFRERVIEMFEQVEKREKYRVIRALSEKLLGELDDREREELLKELLYSKGVGERWTVRRSGQV